MYKIKFRSGYKILLNCVIVCVFCWVSFNPISYSNQGKKTETSGNSEKSTNPSSNENSAGKKEDSPVTKGNTGSSSSENSPGLGSSPESKSSPGAKVLTDEEKIRNILFGNNPEEQKEDACKRFAGKFNKFLKNHDEENDLVIFSQAAEYFSHSLSLKDSLPIWEAYSHNKANNKRVRNEKVAETTKSYPTCLDSIFLASALNDGYYDIETIDSPDAIYNIYKSSSFNKLREFYLDKITYFGLLNNHPSIDSKKQKDFLSFPDDTKNDKKYVETFDSIVRKIIYYSKKQDDSYGMLHVFYKSLKIPENINNNILSDLIDTKRKGVEFLKIYIGKQANTNYKGIFDQVSYEQIIKQLSKSLDSEKLFFINDGCKLFNNINEIKDLNQECNKINDLYLDRNSLELNDFSLLRELCVNWVKQYSNVNSKNEDLEIFKSKLKVFTSKFLQNREKNIINDAKIAGEKIKKYNSLSKYLKDFIECVYPELLEKNWLDTLGFGENGSSIEIWLRPKTLADYGITFNKKTTLNTTKIGSVGSVKNWPNRISTNKAHQIGQTKNEENEDNEISLEEIVYEIKDNPANEKNSKSTNNTEGLNAEMIKILDGIEKDFKDYMNNLNNLKKSEKTRYSEANLSKVKIQRETRKKIKTKISDLKKHFSFIKNSNQKIKDEVEKRVLELKKFEDQAKRLLNETVATFPKIQPSEVMEQIRKKDEMIHYINNEMGLRGLHSCSCLSGKISHATVETFSKPKVNSREEEETFNQLFGKGSTIYQLDVIVHELKHYIELSENSNNEVYEDGDIIKKIDDCCGHCIEDPCVFWWENKIEAHKLEAHKRKMPWWKKLISFLPCFSPF